MCIKTANVLIAGGTSGIGRELCKIYLSKGCKVAITGRREKLLEEIKNSASGKVFIYRSDIMELNNCALIEQAAKDMGGIDVIIICSGIGNLNPDLLADIEIKTVKTNVLGFTDFAAAAYRYFDGRFKQIGKGGVLAGISSIASFRGSDYAPAYYASKAYVSNYLEGMRKKAAKEKSDIKVCTVIPGYVDTVLAGNVGGKSLFWVAPLDKAAKQIYNAISKGRKIVYITKRWRFIAWLLKFTPDFIYYKV